MPSRFTPARVAFGRRPAEDFDDDGTGVPKPHRGRALARRTASIRQAREAMEYIPGPGESLHVIVEARTDLTDLVDALIDRAGPCETMKIATLGYNEKNLRALLAWSDAGRARSVALVASIFFRSHNGELWERTQAEFRARGNACACCHSHAKVIAMTFPPAPEAPDQAGPAYVIEGSANLCGNGSGREQFALFDDPGLAAFHGAWIDDLIKRHGGTDGR